MSDATQATGAVFAIVVNGEQRAAKPGDSVTDLLHALGLENGRVAIERNREIAPRSQWTEIALAEGDHLEIVQFVGGG